jgi:ribosome-associated protein
MRIPFEELTFTYSRSSGAGGQNVNKVNSKVTMEWAIGLNQTLSPDVLARFRERYGNLITQAGMLQISCQESRSQKMNQDECIARLNRMIENVLVPPKPRKKTKPKRSAVLDRLNTKKLSGLKKKLRGKIEY